jgi:hypothetical protein
MPPPLAESFAVEGFEVWWDASLRQSEASRGQARRETSIPPLGGSLTGSDANSTSTTVCYCQPGGVN